MENKRRKSLTKRDLDLDAMASISEKNQEATETKDDDIATDTESRRIIRSGSRTGSASQSGDDRLEDVDRESEVRDDQEEEAETRTTNERRVQERIVTGKIKSHPLSRVLIISDLLEYPNDRQKLFLKLHRFMKWNSVGVPFTVLFTGAVRLFDFLAQLHYLVFIEVRVSGLFEKQKFNRSRKSDCIAHPEEPPT